MRRAFSPAIVLFVVAVIALLFVTQFWRQFRAAPVPSESNANAHTNTNIDDASNVALEVVKVVPNTDLRVLTAVATSRPVLLIPGAPSTTMALSHLETLDVGANHADSAPLGNARRIRAPASLPTESLRLASGVPTTQPLTASSPSTSESGAAGTLESGPSFEMVVQAAVSILVLGAALWILIGNTKPENTKWATATIGTVVGFWLHTS